MIKCDECGYSDNGTGDFSHACGPIKLKNDESHLPVSEQSLVFRLRMRAEIRRQIPGRKSVQENRPDRIADLLEEAAVEIDRLNAIVEMYREEYDNG